LGYEPNELPTAPPRTIFLWSIVLYNRFAKIMQVIEIANYFALYPAWNNACFGLTKKKEGIPNVEIPSSNTKEFRLNFPS
jgi:hypothetical protein